MMTATEPTFLYPISRQFPFDEVCERIVRELKARNFTVPGLDVEFDVYGTGDEKYRLVHKITGADFRLYFGRSQGRLGRHWFDVAAITEIRIPRRELHIYEDHSGPTFYVYVGEDWSRDRDKFENGSKVNSKLHGKPRIYLRYSGACTCRQVLVDPKGPIIKHSHPGRCSPMLMHDNDLGREYDPRGKEPTSYQTADVFAEFTQWITDHVLALILRHPVAEERVDIFRQTATPFPEGLGPIFCFGERKDAYRITTGRTNRTKLDPSDRYGMLRPQCGFGPAGALPTKDTLDVPGWYGSSLDDTRYIIRVTLNRADGIFISDYGAFEKRRSELFEEIKPRDRLTDAELYEAQKAQQDTMVPIAEYQGGFTRPVISVKRELDLDEVEVVSGPWPDCQFVDQLADSSLEVRALLEAAIHAMDVYHESFNRTKRDASDQAVMRLVEAVTPLSWFQEALATYSQLKYHKYSPEAFVNRIVSAAQDMRRHGLFQ